MKFASLGKPAHLSMRIVAGVAYKSVRVRLGRSLVTLSSVVLAVAFLVTVIVDTVTSRAVYDKMERDTKSRKEAAEIRAMAVRPRKPLQLLELWVDPGKRTQTQEWCNQCGFPLPALDPKVGAAALKLGKWTDDLTNADRYGLLRNQDPMQWVLSLQTPQDVQAFLARTFRGTTVVERDMIPAIQSANATLKQFMEALSSAEQARMQQIQRVGGSQKVQDLVRSATSATVLDAQGLPLWQVSTDLAALKKRFDLEAVGLAALQVMEEKRRSMVNVNQENSKEIRRLQKVAKEMSQGPERTEQLRKAAQMSAEVKRIAGIVVQRVTMNALAKDTLAPEIRLAAQTALQEGEFDRLLRDLAETKRLDELNESFVAKGYDPVKSQRRSMWLLALSLLVCVVGIVNSMMMAVTERYREIATMKCLGATDSFILKAFLIESGALGAMGATLGSFLGVLISLWQNWATFGGTVWASLSVGGLFVTMGFALLAGVVLTILGALFPAWRAARLHPIEAMRLEGL